MTWQMLKLVVASWFTSRPREPREIHPCLGKYVGKAFFLLTLSLVIFFVDAFSADAFFAGKGKGNINGKGKAKGRGSVHGVSLECSWIALGWPLIVPSLFLDCSCIFLDCCWPRIVLGLFLDCSWIVPGILPGLFLDGSGIVP